MYKKNAKICHITQEMAEKLNFKKGMNQESSRDPKVEVYAFSL